MRESLGQEKRKDQALWAEAKARAPGLCGCVPAELPGAGAKDSMKQVVAAHFVNYPDTAEMARIRRWLIVRLNDKHFALAVTADSAKVIKEEEHRRRR